LLFFGPDPPVLVESPIVIPVAVRARRRALLAAAAVGTLVLGCGGDPAEPPVVNCDEIAPTVLQPGAATIIDPAETGGCVRFPDPSSGAEHLVVALSTAGTEAPDGVEAPYVLRMGIPATAAPPAATLRSPYVGGFGPADRALEFHHRLRERERAVRPVFDAPDLSRSGVAAVPPVVGHQRTFKVCASTSCSSFVDRPSTAQFVGDKVAIYVDDEAPTPGYTPTQLAEVGALFDDFLYPIDTAAFGAESDVDQNGVVVVLLTQQVNNLSGSCNQTGSVILGYFFGTDLVPGQQGSNGGEVFYGLVPDPDNANCTISQAYATRLLPPTFVHEFQHMISYNAHVRVNGGLAEDTWLNEGLSHFAEELAGRLIPDERCAPSGPSQTPDCFTQFTFSNVSNAYNYLSDLEQHFLIEPGSSSGTLEERGANWLFVRWLADHFGAPAPLGTSVTRALVQTNRLGAANVAAVAAQPFATLVTEWQLANYLDDLGGSFTPANSRLQYASWDFRELYGSLHQQAPNTFPCRASLSPCPEALRYPLQPDTAGSVYERRGTLRAGSGRHLLVQQAAGGQAVDLSLADTSGGAIPAAAQARLGVIRLR
jgi:hypothetical protein